MKDSTKEILEGEKNSTKISGLSSKGHMERKRSMYCE